MTTLAAYLPLEISVLNTTADPEDFEEFQKKVFASIVTPKYEDNPEGRLIVVSVLQKRIIWTEKEIIEWLIFRN